MLYRMKEGRQDSRINMLKTYFLRNVMLSLVKRSGRERKEIIWVG